MERRPCITTMLAAIATLIFLNASDAKIGVNYGNLGDNLPPATQVLDLCVKHGITRIRIFEPFPDILQALSSHSQISAVVGVRNQDIQAIATDYNAARAWVQKHMVSYPKVKFRYITLGNEISPSDAGSGGIAPFVAPAMVNIHKAISATPFRNKVKVSTVLSAAPLGTSYPPSAGAFRPDMASFINPIIRFLESTRAPLLVNIYPYFAYISDTKNIKLDYALSKPSTVVVDGTRRYSNLFTAILDAYRAAVVKAGGPNVDLVVTETGWPSAGGLATSIENARTYSNNLIEIVKHGTPMKPGVQIETYIFDLIDENLKSPEIEKHWGVFLPNKQLKYPIAFNSFVPPRLL